MIMNSMIITYIVLGVAAFNWRVKLLKSLPKALDVLNIYCSKPEIRQARKNLFIWGFGFILRFIVAGALLMLITDVLGLKIIGFKGMFLWGGAFVVVVSALSVFMSRIEEVNIQGKYQAANWKSQYPFKSVGTDLMLGTWLVFWVITLVGLVGCVLASCIIHFQPLL